MQNRVPAVHGRKQQCSGHLRGSLRSNAKADVASLQVLRTNQMLPYILVLTAQSCHQWMLLRHTNEGS